VLKDSDDVIGVHVCLLAILHSLKFNGHLHSHDKFVFPCFTSVNCCLYGEERNQQGATNLMFILNHLSQHVSVIIMPIFSGTKLFTTAYGVLHCNKKDKSCEVLVP
jgi:hypothetical protein